MKNTERKLNVYLFAAWYPNKTDEFEALFVEKHARIIAGFLNVNVVFAKGLSSRTKRFSVEESYQPQLNTIKVYFRKSRFKFLNLLLYMIAQYKGYKKLADHFGKADVYHLHVLNRSAFLPVLLSFIQFKPYLISEQSTGYLKENGAFRGSFKTFCTKITVTYAAGISTISAALKDAMHQHQLHNRNWQIIPNVVDEQFFLSAQHRNHAYHNHWLHISRMEQKAKNVEGILNTFLKYNKVFPDSVLHMVGSGPDLHSVRTYADEIGLKKQVKFHGDLPLTDIIRLMNKVIAMIHFSNYETQAVVVSEALASGLPVIYTDLPAIKEYAGEADGIEVETGNESKLFLAMLAMNQKYKDYQPMHMSDKAKQKFSEAIITEKFIQFYQKSLGKSFDVKKDLSAVYQ